MHNFPLNLLQEILIFYIFHIAIVEIIHNLVLMDRDEGERGWMWSREEERRSVSSTSQ